MHKNLQRSKLIKVNYYEELFIKSYNFILALAFSEDHLQEKQEDYLEYEEGEINPFANDYDEDKKINRLIGEESCILVIGSKDKFSNFEPFNEENKRRVIFEESFESAKKKNVFRRQDIEIVISDTLRYDELKEIVSFDKIVFDFSNSNSMKFFDVRLQFNGNGFESQDYLFGMCGNDIFNEYKNKFYNLSNGKRVFLM